jgi:hypothetical protein
MNRFHILVGGLVTVVVLSSSAQAATRYAKVGGAASGECLSWARGCTLPHALTQAVDGDEVWVKAGRYAPFALKNGVKIIGGFAGAETGASQSNPTANATIVDGGGRERPVHGENQTATTVLRGFQIINGYDGDDFGGGGLILWDSSPVLVQCTFENNTAAYLGGAVRLRGHSAPQFINCVFRNNGSRTPGGPPYGGGAVFLGEGSASFTNCLFDGNKAGEGGVIAKFGDPGTVFTNCTMVNNQATIKYGGAIHDSYGGVALRNCILWDNTRVEGEGTSADQIYSPANFTEVRHSDIQGGWAGTGNINADPLFNNPAANDYKLRSASPCKDAGENAALPPGVGNLDWDTNTVEPTPKDLGLLPRIRLGTVDMGAYEIFSDSPPDGGN